MLDRVDRGDSLLLQLALGKPLLLVHRSCLLLRNHPGCCLLSALLLHSFWFAFGWHNRGGFTWRLSLRRWMIRGHVTVIPGMVCLPA